MNYRFPNSLSRFLLSRLCLPAVAVSILHAGCRPAATQIETAAPPDATSSEPTFAEQLAQVTAGNSSRIEVHATLIRDGDLAGIAAAKGLETLILDNTEIADDGLAQIAELPNLVDLRLSRTAVTSDGLKHLARLPQLERLRFGSRHVTDAGLAHIAQLANLRALILVDTPISDAGLEHVRDLADLESLYLQRTQVTDDGVDRLQAHRIERGLPVLHVHW